jgi:hypothetical protein
VSKKKWKPIKLKVYSTLETLTIIILIDCETVSMTFNDSQYFAFNFIDIHTIFYTYFFILFFLSIQIQCLAMPMPESISISILSILLLTKFVRRMPFSRHRVIHTTSIHDIENEEKKYKKLDGKPEIRT